MSRLTIIGPEGQREVELLQHNTLGRHPNNTVQVLDRIVSKEHCHLDYVDGRFLLRDLGSLNGTFVNGERISERVLSPGDEIMLGSTRLVFDAANAGLNAPPPKPPSRRPPPPPPRRGPSNPQPSSNPGQAYGVPQSPPPGPPPAPPPPSGNYGIPPAPHQPQQYTPAPGARSTHPGQQAAARPAPYEQAQQAQHLQAQHQQAQHQQAQHQQAQHQQAQQRPVRRSRARPPAPPPEAMSRVTIAPGKVESHIRTKLAPLIDQSFLPEKLIQDSDALRRDYEKLRVSYELARAIGVELDIDKALVKILNAAFQLLPADRGVILLYDANQELQPRCVRTRAEGTSADELVISTTIVEQVLREKAAVLSSDATVDSRFQGSHSIIMQGIRSSMAVPLLHSEEVFGIMMLDSQIATNAFTEKDLQLFQNVANQAAIAIQNSLYATKLEREAITRERFQRLLSPAIAQQVLEGTVEIQKGGESRQTTVLFSDIRGFTAMSEAQAAQDIVDMLNEYFERMVEVIFKYEGTLDKFVGDEIMALFGAPVGHPDDPYRAVKTALEMSEVLRQFNAERIAIGAVPISIGIGINSGECVAGYLGSSKALEYTVIGDTVNTGARLCSIAKAGQIIISQNTFAHVHEYFEVEELPPTSVKGKSQPLKIYNVLGEKGMSFTTEPTRPIF